MVPVWGAHYVLVLSQEAARRLNMSAAVLKPKVRQLGVQRWPSRKRNSLRRLMESALIIGVRSPACTYSESPGFIQSMQPTTTKVDMHSHCRCLQYVLSAWLTLVVSAACQKPINRGGFDGDITELSKLLEAECKSYQVRMYAM
jgi:hypothetical protein